MYSRSAIPNFSRTNTNECVNNNMDLNNSTNTMDKSEREMLGSGEMESPSAHANQKQMIEEIRKLRGEMVTDMDAVRKEILRDNRSVMMALKREIDMDVKKMVAEMVRKEVSYVEERYEGMAEEMNEFSSEWEMKHQHMRSRMEALEAERDVKVKKLALAVEGREANVNRAVDEQERKLEQVRDQVKTTREEVAQIVACTNKSNRSMEAFSFLIEGEMNGRDEWEIKQKEMVLKTEERLEKVSMEFRIFQKNSFGILERLKVDVGKDANEKLKNCESKLIKIIAEKIEKHEETLHKFKRDISEEIRKELTEKIQQELQDRPVQKCKCEEDVNGILVKFQELQKVNGKLQADLAALKNNFDFGQIRIKNLEEETKKLKLELEKNIKVETEFKEIKEENEKLEIELGKFQNVVKNVEEKMEEDGIVTREYLIENDTILKSFRDFKEEVSSCIKKGAEAPKNKDIWEDHKKFKQIEDDLKKIREEIYIFAQDIEWKNKITKKWEEDAYKVRKQRSRRYTRRCGAEETGRLWSGGPCPAWRTDRVMRSGEETPPDWRCEDGAGGHQHGCPNPSQQRGWRLEVPATFSVHDRQRVTERIATFYPPSFINSHLHRPQTSYSCFPSYSSYRQEVQSPQIQNYNYNYNQFPTVSRRRLNKNLNNSSSGYSSSTSSEEPIRERVKLPMQPERRGRFI